LSSCAWISSSFALTFTYLCNIPYIKRNIVKENKSYVRICRSLEVGSKPLHPHSLESSLLSPLSRYFPTLLSVQLSKAIMFDADYVWSP
jgi:hypothetical protein